MDAPPAGMSAEATHWILGLLAMTIVVAGVVAYSFIHQMMKQPAAVVGKKDIYTRVFFLFGVVACLAIISALAVSGALEKTALGQVIVMIVTALGVKKIDDSTKD